MFLMSRARDCLAIVTILVSPILAQSVPPPAASETITVTATRTESRLGDTAASVAVLPRQALLTAPAPTVDEALRVIPGFTLFRRTGSRTANPTAQGVSLRGIGASGASRALVLDDGVPLNDAFGGWIYWSRVPRLGIEQAEILRGGGSELYGSAAMSGVVQFLRSPPTENDIRAEVSTGTHSTRLGSAYLVLGGSSLRGVGNAEWFSTDGSMLVRERDRGAVDRPAASEHFLLDASVEQQTDRARFFVRGAMYDENRNNGTVLQVNDTNLRTFAAGGDAQGRLGNLVARLYATDQEYHQTFSAIAAARVSERLTVAQDVPSRSIGGSGHWVRSLGARHLILIGGDTRFIRGESREEAFSPAGVVTRTTSGGRQRTASAFIEDLFVISPRMTLTGAVRFDSWRNDDGRRDGVRVAERSEESWSPRITILGRWSDALTVTMSAYRGFRAPTLNELYRGFRVGNVLTLANESLRAERLTAFEAGARYERGAYAARATFFEMRMNDAVANVTLSTTPALITRQRQSLGSSRSRGAELDIEWRVTAATRVAAGALFVASTVTAGNLRGRRLPQVPRAAATLQVIRSPSSLQPFSLRSLETNAQLRWSGSQFDDDQNALRLRSYFVADVFAALPLRRRVDLTAAIENIFDRQIEASATPVVTLAQSRAFRVGLRYAR